MNDELFRRDPELGAALTDVSADPMSEDVDWTGLRGAIAARASFELARRRSQRRRMRIAIPAGLAAGVAFLVFLARTPERAILPAVDGTAGAENSIDELLDANVSDVQFRALLSGAGNANELLSIAAAEGQP